MENQSAAAAQNPLVVEHSPATNNYMMAMSSDNGGEGDSMTPNHDATVLVNANGGFNEVTQEVDMRSDDRSHSTVNLNMN